MWSKCNTLLAKHSIKDGFVKFQQFNPKIMVNLNKEEFNSSNLYIMNLFLPSSQISQEYVKSFPTKDKALFRGNTKV